MKINKEMVYRCDHCNRPMFGAGAMSRHEKYCKLNPINQHKCFDFCRFLKKEDDYYRDEFGINHGKTNMICMKKNISMYSYKFEKNYNKPQDALNGLIRMPLECDLHEYPLTNNDATNKT